MTISSPSAIAGTVTKTSENKIVLEFNNEPVPSVKSKVIILDQESHKEIGFVEIVKVKETRALGLLKKGSAKPGDTADISISSHKDYREPAKENTSEILDPSRNERKRVSRISYGVGAELVNTQIMLKTTDNSGTLDGNGFGLRGVMEYSFSPSWILFGSLGLHPLVMASNVADVSSINTNYLATEGIVRYAFEKRSEGLWIGGGAGYYLTMSSNIKPKPANEFVFIGSAGYNIKLSNTYFSLKGDLVWFSSKKSGNFTYQPYQYVVGGVYFF
jgi:hypothetical protein